MHHGTEHFFLKKRYFGDQILTCREIWKSPEKNMYQTLIKCKFSLGKQDFVRKTQNCPTFDYL